MLRSLRQHGDWALLFLRIAIGVIFIYHGMLKWNMEDPSTLFTILKFAEPIGGAALILGALSELAALGLTIIMLGAIYMKSTGFGQQPIDVLGSFGGQGGWEFDLMILAGCVTVLFLGAGKYSVDAAMRK